MGYDRDEITHTMEEVYSEDPDISVDELVEETFSRITNDLVLGDIPNLFYEMAEEWIENNRDSG